MACSLADLASELTADIGARYFADAADARKIFPKGVEYVEALIEKAGGTVTREVANDGDATQVPGTPGAEVTGVSEADVAPAPKGEGEGNEVSPPVTLSGTGPYVKKDQLKADRANKFIGRGSSKSSTNRYAGDFGNRANTGNYAATDVVFISAEGGRRDRLDPDFTEIQKAVDAGATLVTDGRQDRERAYNVGERQVASYLEKAGFAEVEPGVWKNAKPETTIPKTVEESTNEDLVVIEDDEPVVDIAPVEPEGNEIARFRDLAQQLTKIDSDGLIGPKRRVKRALELLKTVTGEAHSDKLLKALLAVAEYNLALEAGGEKYQMTAVPHFHSMSLYA